MSLHSGTGRSDGIYDDPVGALSARLRRPTRREVFVRAAAIYQDRFANAEGRIPATFVIICLTGWAPHDSQQKPLRPGSAAARLAEAREQAQQKLQTRQLLRKARQQHREADTSASLCSLLAHLADDAVALIQQHQQGMHR